MEHKVTLKNGFVLFGLIEDKSEAGIWLTTDQETSFINYSEIKTIRANKE
jgi:hypothetical protein